MKLYYKSGACSLAVRIALKEMGVACDFEAVDLKEKKTETGADFTKVSPKGSVPALQLNDGSLLTENAVIQQYLADSNNATQLLPPVGDMKRYRVLEWLNYISTELHKGCTPIFNPNIPEQVKNDVFKPALKSKLNLVNDHLGKNKYLMNEQFTLADGYLFNVLSWLKFFQMNVADWPNLNRFMEDVRSRPAVQQALKEEQLA